MVRANVQQEIARRANGAAFAVAKLAERMKVRGAGRAEKRVPTVRAETAHAR
jgi:hypothetical protein